MFCLLSYESLLAVILNNAESGDTDADNNDYSEPLDKSSKEGAHSIEHAETGGTDADNNVVKPTVRNQFGTANWSKSVQWSS